jgi:hypothetical protein
MGSQKLSSSTVTELDDNLPCFMDDRRDSVQATQGLPIEVFTWKMALGWGRTRPDSLIVTVKGGHSCCLCGPCVSYCQVISIARWLLIRISATPSDMGEACSLHPIVEIGTTLWLSWGFLDGIDYFVLMAWCYIIYYMSYLCMLSIDC